MGRSLVISPALNKQIDDSTSFDLKVPADANKVGVGEGARFTWTETLEITDASIGAAKYNEETDSVKIQYRVPSTALDSENAGRAGTWWFNVNQKALSDEKNSEHITSLINLGRLRDVAKAAGFDVIEGETNIFEIFEPAGEGEMAPIVGASVTAKIQDKPKRDKDTKEITGRRQDPIKFFPAS